MPQTMFNATNVPVNGLGPLKQSNNKFADKMFTFQPNISIFFFLNFAFPDSANFKNSLFFSLHGKKFSNRDQI